MMYDLIAKKLRLNMRNKKRKSSFQYEIEKSVNAIVDKKLKKTKMDLKSIILSASKSNHNKVAKDFNRSMFSSSDAFGSSNGQILSSFAASLQRNLFRNL